MLNTYTANCFLNSLLREWPKYQAISTEDNPKILIPLDAGKKLEIGLIRFSILGRHQYSDCYHCTHQSQTTEINFPQFVTMICDLFSKDLNIPPQQIVKFKSRLQASDKLISWSLKERSLDIHRLYHSPLSFIESEQSLFIGHNFHPTPKSRDEFTPQDLKKYSPELAGSFPIHWYAASPEIIYQSSSKVAEGLPWADQLARLDLTESAFRGNQDFEKSFIPFPMHPWQLRTLVNDQLFQSYVSAKKLIDIGESIHTWQPTSSLRTLYCEQLPYMLKFSMTVKLTNSIRHLLPKEVDRGQQLQDVLFTEKGQQLASSHPNFHVIHEPAFMALKDSTGRPMAETIVVCRENPFCKQKSVQVLAALIQDPLLGELTPVQSLLQQNQSQESPKQKALQWFRQFLEIAVKPIVDAQVNFGILLGAHQQNLVLELDEQSYPKTAFFRDCQGTGYSELGFSNFAPLVGSLSRENGNILHEPMASYLVGYYLILNSTFNVITAFTNQHWVTELELLALLRDFLQALRDNNPKDPSLLDYLLESKTLMHKGNFICSFKGINENTSDNPLAIYTQVPNPLMKLRASH